MELVTKKQKQILKVPELITKLKRQKTHKKNNKDLFFW
jgi:hypothetical protein